MNASDCKNSKANATKSQIDAINILVPKNHPILVLVNSHIGH